MRRDTRMLRKHVVSYLFPYAAWAESTDVERNIRFALHSPRLIRETQNIDYRILWNLPSDLGRVETEAESQGAERRREAVDNGFNLRHTWYVALIYLKRSVTPASLTLLDMADSMLNR